MPLSGAIAPALPFSLRSGASQGSGAIAPALPFSLRSGRAKYVLLSLRALPCLSPRRGEVSRSDGEGPRAGASVGAPLRRYRASSPLAQARGRAKYVLLSLRALPCLSPRRGGVSRSDGEGARAGAFVGAPLRLYRASSPLAQARGRAKSQALRASSPLALRRGRAKRARSIKNLRQIRSFRIHRRLVLVSFCFYFA